MRVTERVQEGEAVQAWHVLRERIGGRVQPNGQGVGGGVTRAETVA
jgi:hypothetical protein